jgi:radical SAM superfamily enzyme YgiQ (UPF0313 family)
MRDLIRFITEKSSTDDAGIHFAWLMAGGAVKVTFINPNFTRHTSRDALEPLAFAVLSGLTPPSVKRVFYDERVERVPLDEPTDLVAISAQTFTAKRAYCIAAEYRKRGVPVVLGGYHPTLQAEEASRYADSVAVGDAEEIWPSILEDAAAGSLKSRYMAPVHPGQTTFRTVYDRSIFHGKPYPVLKPVQFSRGCRFDCDFCSVRAFYGSGAKHRDPADVIDEIRGLRSRYLFFVDDNLFANRSLLDGLLAALKPLKKMFACQVSIDAARDDSLPRRMAEAGCRAVFIGFESFDEGNLAAMNKRANRSAEYREVVGRFKSHGIMVTGSFMFGYDHDSQDTIRQALEFAVEQKLCLAHFNLLFPFPGTPLLYRLKAEHRLLYDDWWINDDYRYGKCHFRPRRMEPEDLELAIQKARTEFNRIGSILHRFTDLRANAASLSSAFLYWSANLTSRAEIARKLRMGVGA